MRRALPPDIKRFIEYKLSHLGETERYLREYKNALMPSSTPAYSAATGGGSGESRPAESLGIKLASDAYIIETEKTLSVIQRILDALNKTDYELISLVYINRFRLSKEAAALRCHVSKSAAYERINAVLYEIAFELGYVNIDTPLEKRKKQKKFQAPTEK